MERTRTPLLLSVVLFSFLIAQVAIAGGGKEAQTSAGVKKQINGLKKRIAALEAKPDQVGQVPASLPPSGPAGGELAGSYPNPAIGTVAGLDLASSTSTTGGINFAPDASLYRSAANTLKTDDALDLNGLIAIAGGGITVEETNSTIWLGLPNQVILHAQDNGSGKTRLLAQFPTGGAVPIATEP